MTDNDTNAKYGKQAAEATYEYDTDSAEITLANAGTAMLDSITTANDARIESYGFDATTDDAMVTIFNAEEDGTSLNEWLTKRDDSGALVHSGAFAINGIILRPGTRVDPVTGSRTPCVNTILITVDGEALVSQSNGIARTAARIVRLMEDRGWPEEGLAVCVKEQKLDRGRTYKKLALA